ncbi:hypothetical protein Pan44_49040 [Caulifigura coniformis]|uniref:PRC-barrel domain-containing protein n=1 Tax=Caulifigura coniformis TaxID=2527983 RepID=A0A517SL39_9PLAN|nr:PRC-barrel domain-containing protein [Caulifigura coniformis]QDT56844.1 hypothetical protein Pan44_49040 [Caulifigura coniformis]
MSKRHYFLKTALAGLTLAAATAQLSAQDRAGGSVEVRRISNILKTKVVIQDDKPAGEIVDVVYSEGGCIDYYVASYDNRQYVVPFDVVQYRPADRIVFVDIAPTQFERVQFFSSNQWPDLYAPGFRDQVFASFNVRAGGRNRTTFRQGADVDVDIRNRDRDRDPDPANRDNAADRDRPNRDRNQDDDRNRPSAGTRDSDRPNAGTRDGDRPDRAPTPAPGAKDDRPRTEPRDNAPPRAEPGTNPGRNDATPPRARAGNNADRGPATPPKPGVNPGSSSGAGSTPPARSGAESEKKPLTPPPVVPK